MPIAVSVSISNAISIDWGPYALLGLQAPPRYRAHDGILSVAIFLSAWPWVIAFRKTQLHWI